jgi:TolB protein
VASTSSFKSIFWPVAVPLLAALAVLATLLVAGAGSASTASGLIAFTRADGIYVMRADGTGVRPLRKGPAASMAVGLDWSPDGRKLAFSSGGGLWVMDADGKNLARLVAPRDVDGWEGSAGSPSWSPDGRRIAFSIGIKCCSQPRYEKIKGIWVVNADGSNVHRLLRLAKLGADTGVSDMGVGEIDWSPQGKRFAFAAHSGWIAGVYVVNTDGTSLRRLSRQGWTWADFPRWSPDGRRIAFEQNFPTRTIYAGTSEIYTMNVDSGPQVRLTKNKVPDSSPAWSPDGRRIAFVRFDTCPSCPASSQPAREIYVMNADGTGLTNLTHNKVGEASPAWQPTATP